MMRLVPAGHGDGAGLSVVVVLHRDGCDQFVDVIRTLVADLPEDPGVLSYGEGGHTRVFCNEHTIEAFSWLAGKL